MSVLRRTVAVAAALAVAALAVPSSLAAERDVKVKDDYFKPSSLTIKKGTTITWQWRGQSQHNVVVGQGPSQFRSKIKTKGTYSHTFKKLGTYHLTCTVHAGMNMKVVVKKHL